MRTCRCMRSSVFFRRSSNSKAFSLQAPNAASSSTLLRGSCRDPANALQIPPYHRLRYALAVHMESEHIQEQHLFERISVLAMAAGMYNNSHSVPC